MKTSNKGVYIKVLKNNNRLLSGYYSFHIVSFAEREGFEPPDPLRSTVFKTAAFDHSAIFPLQKYNKFSILQKKILLQ